MKNIEKGRETEERMKAHNAKYPLTEEEAFNKTEEESVEEVIGADEWAVTTSNEGVVTSVPLKESEEFKYELDEFVNEDLGKFKQIDVNTSAYEIPTLGCIVRSYGIGTVFVPNASLTEDGDGMFNLIRGRVIK